jgi:hypothetical protein
VNKEELVAALDEEIALLKRVRELLSKETTPKPKRKYKPRGERGVKG